MSDKPVVEETPAAVDRGGRRRRRGPNAVVASTSVLAVGAALVAGWGTSTWAAWSDSAAVTGTTLSTGTFVVAEPPPAPVITKCAPQNGNTGNNIEWTWANTSPTTAPTDTQFKITYSNFTSPGTLPVPATQNLTVNTPPYAGVTIPYNDWSGDFYLTVTTPGGTSVASKKFHFAGKNATKTCTQVQ